MQDVIAVAVLMVATFAITLMYLFIMDPLPREVQDGEEDSEHIDEEGYDSADQRDPRGSSTSSWSAVFRSRGRSAGMVAQRGARQTTTRSARHAELVEDGERLCRAAARGDLEALRKCIVAEGVRVNACDYDRRSALHLAAAEGHASVAEFLVGARADVNARDRWGNTPLRDAERGWHVKVVKLLQQRGAAGSLRGGSHGSLAADESALGEMFCHASAVGDLGMISRLLRKKASVDSCDSDHRSALHLVKESSC
jgi:ankyrin repeat protein